MEIFWLNLSIEVSGVIFALQWCSETNSSFAGTSLNDFFKTGESTRNDKENVSGVQLNEFLVGVLASPLRGNGGNSTFQNLQQRLLHTLTRNIACNRGVLSLAGNLVDFIDIDNALFSPGNIKISSLEKLQQNVFNVFTDITCFSETGRIGDRERNVQPAR